MTEINTKKKMMMKMTIEEKLAALGIHESWKMHNYMHKAAPALKLLNDYREQGIQYCPRSDLKDVFRPFSMPLQNVRMVIIGQDPYPDYNVANGLAFDANETIPYSLKIIQDTYAQQVHNLECFSGKFPHPNLKLWFHDGVLLLNSSLTCDVGKPNSHVGIWRPFMEEIVRTINNTKTDVVFCLWGAEAQKFEKLITSDNIVLKTNHPAATAHGHEFNPRFDILVKMFPELDLPF